MIGFNAGQIARITKDRAAAFSGRLAMRARMRHPDAVTALANNAQEGRRMAI